jgi:hypothetical protein
LKNSTHTPSPGAAHKNVTTYLPYFPRSFSSAIKPTVSATIGMLKSMRTKTAANKELDALNPPVTPMAPAIPVKDSTSTLHDLDIAHAPFGPAYLCAQPTRLKTAKPPGLGFPITPIARADRVDDVADWYLWARKRPLCCRSCASCAQSYDTTAIVRFY